MYTLSITVVIFTDLKYVTYGSIGGAAFIAVFIILIATIMKVHKNWLKKHRPVEYRIRQERKKATGKTLLRIFHTSYKEKFTLGNRNLLVTER